MGQALRLEVILLSKEKAAAPRPKPRGRPRQASRQASREVLREASREANLEAGLEATGRQTLQNLPNPQLPSKPSKPSKHLPQQAPQGQGHFSIRPPRAKATAMAFYWLSKLPFASPQTLQTLQNPPNTPNTIQNPPNPPGLEACFEQVAQGLWLVRRVHRRSKTISLPGRLELPTLRLTASRSNQLSYGSLCRRPKLVPVLEKRLNNSWLQMVCQTKGQQPK